MGSRPGPRCFQDRLYDFARTSPASYAVMTAWTRSRALILARTRPTCFSPPARRRYLSAARAIRSVTGFMSSLFASVAPTDTTSVRERSRVAAITVP